MDTEQLFKNLIHTYITEESRIYIPSWIQEPSQTLLAGVVDSDKHGLYLSVYRSPTFVPAEQRNAVISLPFEHGFLRIDEETCKRSDLMKPTCTLMRAVDHFEIFGREPKKDAKEFVEGLI
ncbi:MAG TPA: hypothetical protein VJK72_06030 [Candidatus Nanoarchaeia archaeon]|nr:hypothetical protein [Candidatus Nanoarchaeia archaeon]